ncbi:alpha-glucosidase-like [Amphiura filiformis]|uniref:alpha-glucosidase-like n=1 Tax=Amphiura filiformis TaxID=82378 RepID=UPI003B228098
MTLHRLWTICLLIGMIQTNFLLKASAKTFTWREWWKHTVIYQIYSLSFMDTNGDGFGDLNGIRSRLDYLVDIGIDTVWMTPVYESPMKDFGYDISNYTKIYPLFGTMEDFDALIHEMHVKGIRLIMDFVPNHTSDKHKWFVESRKSKNISNTYRDYYVWKDPKTGCQDPDKNSRSDTCIPNNWVGHFGGSTWTWVPERKQYYYHQNLKEQPDVNYRNPKIVEEMKDALRFWLDRGVDGFRVDSIRYLYEDESFADEPIDPNFIPPPNMTQPLVQSLLHWYTADLPEIHTVVKSWRSEVFAKYSTPPNYRFLGTQAYGNATALSLYYGSKDEPEADFPFNFQMIMLKQETLSGIEVHRLIDEWLTNIPHGAWPNWVFSHHGKDRIANRFGPANHRGGLILNLLLPGTPNVYYGEELGMSDIDIKFEDQQDPGGKNNPCCWKKFNRDQHRSPMQWDSNTNAGFSASDKTWLPVHENYLRGINVLQLINFCYDPHFIPC